MADQDQDIELNFAQYVEILSRRRWIVVLIAFVVFAASAGYAFLATPVYRASTLLNIEYVRKAVTSGGPTIEEDSEDYFETQFKLIKSDTLLRRVYDDQKLALTPDFASGLGALREAVAVSQLPRTRLATVSVDSTDPALAARLSNTITQYFVEQNLNNQLFMSKEVLDALQQRMTGAEAQRVNESLPSVVNNRLIQSIKEQIFGVEAQLADLRMKYTDQHPQVIALRSRLDSMKKVLNTEVENVVQSLKTELSGQLQGNNVRIVDAAKVPERPVKPRKLLAVLFGLIGGLSLGVFAAVIVELLDQTVRTQDDLERKIGLPFLGVIPLSRHKKNAKAYEHMLSPDVSLTSEAFRNLRTMVDFAESVDGENAIIVTSSVQEEGKSFVATNLAVALAQLGRNVLMVDGDLRRPRQHRNLMASSEKGLSDFLSGAVKDPAELVQKTEVPNLEIITCGPRPPNPAELLNTEKLAEFVAWARKRYGRIVVDCTPVFPISDTMLWGRHVRQAVFVARFGRTRAPLIRTACARLRSGGLKLLGGIINGARQGTMSYADGRYYEQYYRDYAEPDAPKTRGA
ncbi:MAG: polysaccharide biosynthesis tyrosine autokinase [Elusimicrobiota bacterium]|nr:polysaccharide biosynthesis tyrosine autokinase [Elusimicrobiota bacterium]